MSHHLKKTGLLSALLLAVGLQLGCGTPAPSPIAPVIATTTAPAVVREALAPSNRLRIAVYPGSPTSLVRASGATGERGLTVELGRELAQRLGVPAELVVFERVAQIVDALQAGQVDMTITNATPARAALVDFTPPVVRLELGYLVLPGSPINALDQVDQPGRRVGVSQGSSSQAALTRSLKQADVVPAASLKQAGEMLKDGRLDAFATNKGILFELADGLPGARVLDGRWGLESLAIAVPKGRGQGAEFLQRYVESVRVQGLVQQAATHAGLRGLAEPERR
jgi:polar amino acid transport system substrate-binding protein